MKRSLSIAAVFGASLIFSATSSNYVPVKAADVSDTNTIVNNQGVSDKTWSKKLAKAGYVFKLTKDEVSADGGLFQRKNGSLVHIVSQNGKYKFWTNFLTGTYNVNGLRKALKPLIKAEAEVIHTTSKEKKTKMLVTAEKLANKLKGSDKKLAQESIIQLKQWIDNKVFANIPTLLIGNF